MKPIRTGARLLSAFSVPPLVDEAPLALVDFLLSPHAATSMTADRDTAVHAANRRAFPLVTVPGRWAMFLILHFVGFGQARRMRAAAGCISQPGSGHDLFG